MLRVLQIVTQMNRAGLESRLMDLLRQLDRDAVQFDFYTCREEPGFFDQEIQALGGKVFYSPPLSVKRLPGIPLRFKRFLLDHPEYQVVHCHLNQWCGLVLLGAKQAGIPVRIAHSRTSLDKASLKNLVKNLIKLPVNHSATHRFAVSKKAGVWLYGKRRMAKNQVQFMPNAIPLERFSYDANQRIKTRMALGLSDELVLVHVGNLRPEKNHAHLLKVLQAVLQKQPHVVLLLVGADYMEGAVQQQASDLGVEKQVRFLGARSDVPELLSAADVFVFPSLYEGFGTAVLEAQASGLPCVISDTIPEEACLLPSTRNLSLSSPPEKWADMLLSMSGTDRKDCTEVLMKSGFSVENLATNLTAFYLSAIPDKGEEP